VSKQVAKTPQDFAEVVGEAKIKQLRESVNPTGKKGTWMRVLNDKQLAEVYFRLNNGEAAYAVTCMIQRDFRIKQKTDVKSMARAVRKFRDDVVGEIRCELQNAGKTQKEITTAENAVAKIADKVDAVQEFIWLIQTQRTRIQNLVTAESNSEFAAFEMTDKAMKNFKEMLEGYTSLCIRLGIKDSVTPELNIRLKGQFDHVMKHVVGNDRAKMVQACDAFVEQLEDACVMLTQNEDGSFSKVENVK